MKSIIAIILFLTTVIVFACLVQGCVVEKDRRDINSWVTSKGDSIVSIEQKYWSIGPYWVSKNRRIYQVFTSDKHEYWFRMGNFFRDDVEEKVAGGYNILQ